MQKTRSRTDLSWERWSDADYEVRRCVECQKLKRLRHDMEACLMCHTHRDTAIAQVRKPDMALAGWYAKSVVALRFAAVTFCAAVWAAVIYWAFF
ncbi:MAG: hypothetical protein ACI9IV_002126 [Paracoccaceae bacterium]|jgi:hypothetical protein